MNTQPTFNNSLDNAPTSYSGTEVVLDGSVEIVDAELNALNSGYGDFYGSTLTLQRQGGANPEDVFGLDSNSFYSLESDMTVRDGEQTYSYGTYTNANGVFTINFNNHSYDEASRINAILSSITYSNSTNPTTGSAVIEWTFNDGSGQANNLATGSTTVTFAEFSSPPTPTPTELGASTYGGSTHYYLYYENQVNASPTAITIDDAFTLAANFATAHNVQGFTSHLATITTTDEQGVIGTVFSNANLPTNTHVWLGGTVDAYVNYWGTWTATSELSELTNLNDYFYPDEPTSGDYGISFGYDQGTYYWYGETAEIMLNGMIIEFEPNP